MELTQEIKQRYQAGTTRDKDLIIAELYLNYATGHPLPQTLEEFIKIQRKYLSQEEEGE